MSRPIITIEDIRAVPAGGVLPVPPEAIITDMAREVAQAHQVTLVPAQQVFGLNSNGGGLVVAIGSDHGHSFPLKEVLKPYLVELGYTALDCGAYTPDAVDYPDIAYAVAQQVANGTAWRGIVIDAAGIGSCMVANKVPGIRAALCYNEAMARNSREHNNANVLTLGAGMIGLNLARLIVAAWLQTDFGGGRHQRRVDKIDQIEQRFLRS